MLFYMYVVCMHVVGMALVEWWHTHSVTIAGAHQCTTQSRKPEMATNAPAGANQAHGTRLSETQPRLIPPSSQVSFLS